MSENNPEKGTVRYSDADLLEFQALVEKKLEKSRKELEYLQSQVLEITENISDEHGGDWMDDSSTNNDVEFLNTMAIRQRQYLRELENALIRIKNKTYGVCAVTGNLIDKRRLLAVPTATKSVEAKNAEKEAEALKKPVKQETTAPKAPVSGSPTVITKVIRKSSTNKPEDKTKLPVFDDDDFDNSDDDNFIDDDDNNDMDVDIDQIADDGGDDYEF
jgi:RNA polymerase-binding transcription factor DksA